MLGEPCFLDGSADMVPICTDALDRVFGQIVVPRYAVVIEKGEEAVAIAEQALLQGLRRIGFVGPTHEGIEEGRYSLGVRLQGATFEPTLIDGSHDCAQDGPEWVCDALKLVIERVVEDSLIYIAHQMNEAPLLQAIKSVVGLIKVGNQHAFEVSQNGP